MNQTESDGRKKLEWAKDAAKGFVNAIINSGSTSVKVSVSSFGAQGNDGTGILTSEYNSTLNSPLTPNLSSVVTSIGNIAHIKPGTCIQCGIRIGNSQLTNNSNRRVQILLSDGMANHSWRGNTDLDDKETAINEANQGRSSGIEYRAIGYGQKSTNQIDEQTLISIAGGSLSNYQYKPNVADWSSAFLTILNELCGTTPPTPPTPTKITPVADSYVDGTSYKGRNYGANTTLNVDSSPIRITYFKFDLTQLAGKTFKNAALRIKVSNESVDLQRIKSSTNTSWGENTITYNNRPTLSSSVINTFKGGTPGFWSTIDITQFVNTNKGKVVTLGIDTSGSDGLDFNSKESTTDKPEIVIEY